MFKVTSQQSGDENQKQVSGPPGLFLQGGRAAPSHPTSTSAFCYCVNQNIQGLFSEYLLFYLFLKVKITPDISFLMPLSSTFSLSEIGEELLFGEKESNF